MSPAARDAAEQELVALFSAIEPGRRGEILAAALSVFADSGYDCGSMRSIAEKVGVTEPALYRHFPGKEAILGALVMMVGTRLRSEAVSLIEGLSAAGLREQLLAAVGKRHQVADVFGPLLRILLPIAARNEALRNQYRDLVIVPTRAMLTAKAAEIDAELGVPDAEATRESRVRSVLALVVGFIASSFVIGDSPDEAIVDAALRVMRWEG
jgi:AcrR family transcriptional regulator